MSTTAKPCAMIAPAGAQRDGSYERQSADNCPHRGGRGHRITQTPNSRLLLISVSARNTHSHLLSDISLGSDALPLF